MNHCARASKVPMVKAAEKGHLMTLQFLFGRAKKGQRRTMLQFAVDSGMVEVLRLLLANGADVEAVLKYGHYQISM